MIEDGAIDSFSKLVAVNVNYFKGLWKFPFNVDDTEPMNFTINSVIVFKMLFVVVVPQLYLSLAGIWINL